jgi:NAD(P)-dependent dehydrogenase (short-subunit alcohol dehydrogenase family)
MRLEGKVAVVTGAAGAIGAATSRRLASEGAAIVLADFESEALEALAAELGERALARPTDVRHEHQVAAAVQAAVEHFGGIDVLHNNAVGAVPDDVDALLTPDSTWREHFDVIVMAAVWGCRHAIPRMIERGGGSIVHTSSMAAHIPPGGKISYAAMKAGLESFSASIAVLHGEDGIRSNCVAPGLIVHPAVAALVEPGELEKMARGVALGRNGHPDDIAGVVAFLASDDAAYVTGQVVKAHGGGVKPRRW